MLVLGEGRVGEAVARFAMSQGRHVSVLDEDPLALDRLDAATDDGWEADGEFVRQAYTLRAEDDDFGQAGAMVREVFDDAARERFVATVAGHLLGGGTEPVLERAFEYWRNVDAEIGKRIEEAVRAEDGTDVSPGPTEPEGVLVEG